MKTVDLYNDPGHSHLRHLLERHPGVAEFVKEAEFEDDLDGAPGTVFADWDVRRYPVHTAPQAVISYLYAKEASAHPLILESIKIALDAYAVPSEIFEPVEVKLAAPAEDDCLFPESRAYPVRTADEVKTAERRLLSQLDKLGTENRTRVFGRLYKAAAQHQVELQTVSYQYAGVTKTASQNLVSDLRARAAMVKDAAVAAKFSNLADAVKKEPWALRQRSLQAKLASTIAELDEQGGLDARYGRKLADAVQTVYNTDERTDKLALDIAGTDVSMEKLMSVGAPFYGDLLGPDVVREIAPSGHLEPEKLAMVIDTLPLDLKRTLVSALKSAGR